MEFEAAFIKGVGLRRYRLDGERLSFESGSLRLSFTAGHWHAENRLSARRDHDLPAPAAQPLSQQATARPFSLEAYPMRGCHHRRRRRPNAN